MKKYLLILLVGFCFTISGSVFAGDVRDVDSEAWLEHITQMRLLRQQILRIVTKANPTVQDREMLDALNRAFDEEKRSWDNYLVKVAQGEAKAPKSAKYTKAHRSCTHRAKVKAHKCSQGKACGHKVKGHVCPKGDKCCKITGIKSCSDGKDCCDKSKVKAHKCSQGKACGHKVKGYVCPKGDKCCKITGIKSCADGKDCCDKSKLKAHKCSQGKACGHKVKGYVCPKGDKCCKITGIKSCSDGKDCCQKSSSKIRRVRAPQKGTHLHKLERTEAHKHVCKHGKGKDCCALTGKSCSKSHDCCTKSKAYHRYNKSRRTSYRRNVSTPQSATHLHKLERTEVHKHICAHGMGDKCCKVTGGKCSQGHSCGKTAAKTCPDCNCTASGVCAKSHGGTCCKK